MGTALVNREEQVRRGLRLEYWTVGYNALEAVVALVSGAVAGSIALIGFGVDSVIEVSSALVLLWRLHSDAGARDRAALERRALRLVGVSFLLLAAYVAVDASLSLYRREAPEESVPGLALAIASLIVMPLLARAKSSVAASLSSAALRADSKQTELCAYLSAILLGGLGLNALFGWWWADPLAALVMVPIITREGIQALRGHGCGCNSCH
ncbi:MAG: cation transporter [Bryobacteraceae bacterium]|nr:cation transporter [Bryobacteraceae bacterium]